MKKLLTLLAFAGLFSLVACGPSKEEQEKAEKARMDSIAKDSTDKAAAMAAVAAKASADSMAAAQAAADKAKADSIAMAEKSKKPMGKGKGKKK